MLITSSPALGGSKLLESIEKFFGYGFDNVNSNLTAPNGWETHFVIGQRF